jgi:hypothetical protein
MKTEITTELIATLKARFDANPIRHEGIDWELVEARLRADESKLRTLFEMEKSGGEPDVVGVDNATGEVVFVDCAEESPKGRRSLCFDREGWESRKEHRPEGNAGDAAAAMGIELLTEDQYRDLQKLGEFDLKTSSWIKTPDEIRRLGGALFGDRRYGAVFIYHNGAQSYYAARGFRGSVKV